MSLFDFFFPEQAQATHLRRLADNQRRSGRQRVRGDAELRKRVDALEDDLGYVALVLCALLQKADEKGVLTRDEVRAAVAELDEIDGVKDGKLDVNVLKGMGR